MLFTFLKLPNPQAPLEGQLAFYLISYFPPRFAEGTVFFHLGTADLVENTIIKEHKFTSFEEAFRILLHSLAARNLIVPFAAHEHSNLETALLRHLPQEEPPRDKTPVPGLSSFPKF